jgi:hypothetical protein
MRTSGAEAPRPAEDSETGSADNEQRKHLLLFVAEERWMARTT